MISKDNYSATVKKSVGIAPNSHTYNMYIHRYLQQNKTIRHGIFRSSKAIEETTYYFETGIHWMPISCKNTGIR